MWQSRRISFVSTRKSGKKFHFRSIKAPWEATHQPCRHPTGADDSDRLSDAFLRNHLTYEQVMADFSQIRHQERREEKAESVKSSVPRA